MKKEDLKAKVEWIDRTLEEDKRNGTTHFVYHPRQWLIDILTNYDAEINTLDMQSAALAIMLKVSVKEARYVLLGYLNLTDLDETEKDYEGETTPPDAIAYQ